MTAHPTHHRWFPFRQHRPGAGWRLFCFAFAGGSAAWFRPWSALLPEDAELWPVELPGHGTRMDDPLSDDMDRLSRDIAAAIAPQADRPIVLFGHSMGSAIVLAVTRILETDYGITPRLVVCSGRIAPHCVRGRQVHLRTDDGLREEIIRLGGTDPEILEHQDLMAFILPIVRNDFRLIETWAPAPDPVITPPILVLSGRDDLDAPPDALPRWGDLSRGGAAIALFEGGHFFVNDQIPAVVATVVNAARRAVSDLAA